MQGPGLFHLNDYIDDVRDTVLQSRYRSYPILDEEERSWAPWDGII